MNFNHYIGETEYNKKVRLPENKKKQQQRQEPESEEFEVIEEPQASNRDESEVE